MRFISKYSAYKMQIMNEEVAFRMLPGGTVTKETLSNGFVAEFDHERMLPAYERLFAMTAFTGGDARPFGAMPDLQSQAIVNAAGRVIDMTSEYRPDFNFSVFDSESISDLELREAAEQKLLSDPMFGIDYVLVEAQKVPAPWPSYPDTPLDIAVNMATYGGFDVMKVIEYERAHENREEFIVAFGKILADQAVKKNEDDSLTITVQ
jgi:hypothetical protein